jgi:hypothetical protein
MSSMAPGTGSRGRVTDRRVVCACCAALGGPGAVEEVTAAQPGGCGRRARDHGVARFIEAVEQAGLRGRADLLDGGLASPVSPRRTAEPRATSLGSDGLKIRLRIIIILSGTSCLPYI